MMNYTKKIYVKLYNVRKTNYIYYWKPEYH